MKIWGSEFGPCSPPSWTLANVGVRHPESSYFRVLIFSLYSIGSTMRCPESINSALGDENSWMDFQSELDPTVNVVFHLLARHRHLHRSTAVSVHHHEGDDDVSVVVPDSRADRDPCSPGPERRTR